MAAHSSIAWRISWIEEPGGQQSIGLLRVGHNWSDLTCTHTSSVACWTSSWVSCGGSSSSSFIYFCLFILCMGFLWQEYWSGLLSPPPVDHVLSEFFTMTYLSSVALPCMAHGFTELCKPLHHTGPCDIWRGLFHCLLTFFRWLHTSILPKFLSFRAKNTSRCLL